MAPKDDLLSGMILGWSPTATANPNEYFLDGQIDEVRISKTSRYTKNFTPERRFTPDKDTLAQHHFDAGSGDKLTDHSGNNHHGKIHGATWVKADGSPINVGSSNRPNR